MKVRCIYCDREIEATAGSCPFCAAPNERMVRMTADTPGTIEELQAWYDSKKLPNEKITRFFIGKNVAEPRAFGIYKDETTEICEVYVNNVYGERTIEYNGKDEAYAVNLIFMRLKDVILDQKARNLKKKNIHRLK